MKQLYALVNREDWMVRAFGCVDEFAQRHLWIPEYKPLTLPAYVAFMFDVN